MHSMRHIQGRRQEGLDYCTLVRERTKRDYMREDDYSDGARLHERIKIRQFRFRQSILPYRCLGTRPPIMSPFTSSLGRERSE